MVVNKKVTGRSKPMATGLIMGSVISLGLTLLGSAITANLVLSRKIATEAIGYAAVIILLLAAACGAWIGANLVKRRWIVVCMGVGGSYYAILLAITALFFGGQYQGMGVTALAILGGCGGIGLLGMRPKKSRKNRVKKYRFR